MSILLTILGVILIGCAIFIGIERSGTEKPNGPLEWILAIIGVILLAIAF